MHTLCHQQCAHRIEKKRAKQMHFMCFIVLLGRRRAAFAVELIRPNGRIYKFIYDLYEFEYRCEIYVYSVCRALSAYHIEY